MQKDTNTKEKSEVLSILIPVYNERLFVEELVECVLAVSLPGNLERELIIVDDCSTDGTATVLLELERKHPETIRVLVQEENQGKGAAIRRAIEAMRGDIAIFQDADLEYDPQEYGRMLDPILKGRADVVYGSRFLSSPQRRVLNYHHALGNKLLTVLSDLSTGLNLTDMETCYKAFRADLLRSIPIRSNRFGLEPEITAKIARRSCIVYEVPISYYGRNYDEGKKIGWKDGISALYTILKYTLIDDCFRSDVGHSVLEELSITRRLSRWMVDTVAPYLGDRVLEVGSGIGNISRQLTKRESLRVTDCDEHHLKALHQAFSHVDAVSVSRLDLTQDAGFEDLAGQHSSVVCLNVLEHIEDDVAALKRMSSALEPGGHLIILVPQYRWLMSKMDHELGHFRRYTRDELVEKFESVGLRITRTLRFNKLGTLGWFVSNRLLGRTSFGKFQLKIFDMLVPLMSRIEKWIPLPSLSLIVIGTRPTDAPE